jgi:hypothetical protein
MSSAYGKIPKPAGAQNLDSILPMPKVLRDGTKAMIQQVDPTNKPLVDYLHVRFNQELEAG